MEGRVPGVDLLLQSWQARADRVPGDSGGVHEVLRYHEGALDSAYLDDGHDETWGGIESD